VLFANTEVNERQSDAEIASEIAEVHLLALQCNEMVRGAFTISSQSSTQVKSLNFLKSLYKLEVLSSRIKNYS
jgi:hypothetical protein